MGSGLVDGRFSNRYTFKIYELDVIWTAERLGRQSYDL